METVTKKPFDSALKYLPTFNHVDSQASHLHRLNGYLSEACICMFRLSNLSRIYYYDHAYADALIKRIRQSFTLGLKANFGLCEAKQIPLYLSSAYADIYGDFLELIAECYKTKSLSKRERNLQEKKYKFEDLALRLHRYLNEGIG